MSKVSPVTESFPQGITQTRMSDRDLLIHAVQHLEDLSGRLERIEAQVAWTTGSVSAISETCGNLAAELAVFQPLLREIAPGGKVSLGGLLRARREAKNVPVHVPAHERIWGG